jgi:hypothetical protein
VALRVVSGGEPYGAEVSRLRDAARLRRYRECLDFYNGKHWSVVGGVAQAASGRTRLVLNYARAIVDKGASYLLGRGINFAVAETADRRPPAAAGQTPGQPLLIADRDVAAEAERLLYRVYEDNDLAAVDMHGALNAGVLGDAVFKVSWDPAERRVRVVNVDPFCFGARWAPDDLASLRQAELHYSLSDDELGEMLDGLGVAEPAGRRPASTARRSLVERWTPRELTLLVDGQEARRGPNPYGFIPFVHRKWMTRSTRRTRATEAGSSCSTRAAISMKGQIRRRPPSRTRACGVR